MYCTCTVKHLYIVDVRQQTDSRNQTPDSRQQTAVSRQQTAGRPARVAVR
jgi:hypothetical protein